MERIIYQQTILLQLFNGRTLHVQITSRTVLNLSCQYLCCAQRRSKFEDIKEGWVFNSVANMWRKMEITHPNSSTCA